MRESVSLCSNLSLVSGAQAIIVTAMPLSNHLRNALSRLWAGRIFNGLSFRNFLSSVRESERAL